MSKDNLEKISAGLTKGEITPSDLFKSFNSIIKQKNNDIFAFREINPEWEFEAQASTKRWKAKKQKSRYDGIPIAIKDNISTRKLKTCAGSKILENYQAPYDASIIKFLTEKGFIIAGKTNMDEFAMGSSTETSYFGPTKNPLDLTKVPGGSSGGSAAGVASGMVPVALGSDTGGSIRQPASFCGTVGFKPSYGAVSRFGLLAMASSLDQIGTFTNTVDDSKAIFEIISQKDQFDATKTTLSKKNELNQKIKIGYDPEIMEKGLDDLTSKTIKQTFALLENDPKIELVKIKLELMEAGLATYYIIMPAEVSSNLARFDGIKYGLSKKSEDVLGVYLNSRQEGFGKEVKRRIILGTYVLSAGYYDAYYRRAQMVRQAMTNSLNKILENVDAIILPTSPTVAFSFGEKTDDPLKMYLSDIYTVIANLAKLPAISLPVIEKNQLPVGIQLIGRYLDDFRFLDIAKQVERGINHG